MFSNLVVPVDFSPASIKALAVAAKMAAQVGGRVDALTVVHLPSDVGKVSTELALSIEQLGPQPAEVRPLVQASDSVIDVIVHHIELNPGSMVLMSSHGHGRSAAVFGNTVDELVRAMFGPVIVVGPQAGECSGRLDGQYVVPLDGSARAEGVIPIVAAWAIEFHGIPWMVEAIEDTADTDDSSIVKSSYVTNRADVLQQRIKREVEFEVLRGSDIGRSIVDFAEAQDATLIFMSTHGHTGIKRLATGSVTADVIRHATIPVVLFRPPDLK